MYYATGLVGLLMVLSPIIFSFSENTIAFACSAIFGFALVVDSVFEYLDKDKDSKEYWVAAILGLIAMMTPFVLNFENEYYAMMTMVIGGGIVSILGFSKIILMIKEPKISNQGGTTS